MVVRYFDPRGVTVRPPEPYSLSIDLAATDLEATPITLGLIANSFPDATRFTDHVEAALLAAVPGLRTIRYRKPDTSAASPQMRLQIEEECDAVVSAYGH
jgi:hypothetical protein